MKIIVFLYTFLLAFTSFAQENWQSQLVEITPQGKLIYKADKDGFILPDFSHAGYKGGGVKLPEAKTVYEISPVPGDNTLHIQQAINRIGEMPLNKDGIRGALLLHAGIYPISGSLNINFNGVVIRGVGNGEDRSQNTIIFATGDIPHQRDVIVLGNLSQKKWPQNNTSIQNITDETVKAGSQSFTVEDASGYKIGDCIIIQHPCTQEWLDAVKGGEPVTSNGTGADDLWKAGELPISFHRYITSIHGNHLTIDAPIFYTLNKSLSKCYIYKYTNSGIYRNIGIENLRVDIETSGNQEDENHAKKCNCTPFFRKRMGKRSLCPSFPACRIHDRLLYSFYHSILHSRLPGRNSYRRKNV